MYKVGINTTEGKHVATLDFPEYPEEVMLNQYIDFITEYNKFITWLADESEVTDNDFMLTYLRSVLNILIAFTGCKELTHLPPGDIEAHLKELFGVEGDNIIDLEQSTSTLLTIFANVRNLVINYEPRLHPSGDCSFEYKGEAWTFPGIFKSALTNEIRYETLSTGEAIEIMEIIRVWDNNRGKDSDGSVHYTSLLKLIAVAARKDGDTFPTSDVGVEQFINDRINHFAEIDMQTALDIENWITGWWEFLKKKNGFTTSSTRPKNEGTV